MMTAAAAIVFPLLLFLVLSIPQAAGKSICQAGNDGSISSNTGVPATGRQSSAGLFINLNYPSPCSGSLIAYSYCFYMGSEFFSEEFYVQFSSWNCSQVYCNKVTDTIVANSNIFESSPLNGTTCSTQNLTLPIRIEKGTVIGAYIYNPQEQVEIRLTDNRFKDDICHFEEDLSNVTCVGSSLVTGVLRVLALIDPERCEAPAVPRNGQAINQNSQPINATAEYEYGSIISFVCNAGYRLIGAPNITCVTPWSAPIPECIPVHCGNPGLPVYGSRQGDNYTFNSVITFNCTEGYLLNGTSNTIICGPLGKWNSSVPVCIAVDCGDPGIPTDGSRDGDLFVYGSRVQFQCLNGFELNGPGVLVCGSDGLWNATTPMCTRNSGSIAQSTLVVATTLSAFSCIAMVVAFVGGIIAKVYYEKWKETKTVTTAASREDLVYNEAYDPKPIAGLLIQPNTSYNMRPVSEHLYDVIPEGRPGSIELQNQEQIENTYTLSL